MAKMKSSNLTGPALRSRISARVVEAVGEPLTIFHVVEEVLTH